LNILFLNSARRGRGGNEQSVLIATSTLSKEHGVVLAYRKEDIGEHFTITKYRLPFLNEADIYTIARLVQIVRKHSIDVIIPSKRKDYFLAGIVSRLCKTKNIMWLGAVRDLENNPVYNIVYNKLADGIIVNARKIRETLLKSSYMRDDKIKVIYYGIDTENIQSKCPEAPKEISACMTISSMGRLDTNKGPRFLIESFALFLSYEKNINAKLVIIGDGPEKANLQQLAKQLNIEKKINFTGFLENPYPQLHQSDVFALTSISEGLSIALLEAMYLENAPVSTFAGGGVTEIIEEGTSGYLISYGEKEKLADILHLLYRDPLLRKITAAKARQRVMEQYSTSLMKQEITAFLQSLTASTRKKQ